MKPTGIDTPNSAARWMDRSERSTFQAHSPLAVSDLVKVDQSASTEAKAEMSNSDQLFVRALSEDDAGDEHLFSLFQVL
jgi:hypothetical protein